MYGHTNGHVYEHITTMIKLSNHCMFNMGCICDDSKPNYQSKHQVLYSNVEWKAEKGILLGYGGVAKRGMALRVQNLNRKSLQSKLLIMV